MVFNLGRRDLSSPVQPQSIVTAAGHIVLDIMTTTPQQNPSILTLIVPQRQRTPINFEHHRTAHSILDRKIVSAERHLPFPNSESDFSSMLRVVRDD
jgi:hypothetical protein